jgi:putative DNA primase/helicase
MMPHGLAGEYSMTKGIREISILPEITAHDVTDVTDVTSLKSLDFYETAINDKPVTDVTPPEGPLPTSKVIRSEESSASAEPVPHISVDKRPCWYVYDDWTNLDNGKIMRPGTYWLDYEEDKEGNIEFKEKWVCSPLHIEAQTLDRRGNNFGRFLRFKNTVGNWKTWAMPMELLRGSSEELRGTLLSMGVLIDTYCFRDLSRYLLQTVAPKKQLHCSLQTGWYGPRAYVLPDQVIGPEADQVVFQSNQAAHEEFSVAGTLPAWKETVAAMAIGNPMLMLGLSCAFTGPLLALTHTEGGGVHMVGDSSSGKSTIARAASSVWGGKEYRRSWRTTANGLEGAAALFNDGFLVLDEISECDPTDVGEIAYSLGNGCGKQRANRYGSAKPVTRWLCFALSNGERSIATAIKEGGGRVKAGQSMRLLDLPTKRQHGAWDDLHGFSHGAALSDYISSEALANYGHAGRAYLERLSYDNRDFGESLTQIKSLPPFRSNGTEGQEKRAAGRFALIALAGELATEYGITGWPAGMATEAAIIGYTAWKTQRGEGNDEKRQIFTALSDFIERHCDSRFSDMEEEHDNKIINNRAGYWRNENDVRTYYLISDGMNEALRGFDFRLALDLLVQSGIIPPANANGERSHPIRVRGKTVRLYKIDFDLLQNGGTTIYPAQYPGV